MRYDLDFRYKLALAPHALTTITIALFALESAVADARNAGLDPDADPAVRLIARHLAAVSSASSTQQERSHETDEALRRACRQRIAEIGRKPVLVALARAGTSFLPSRKSLFEREATRALRHIASVLALPREACRIDSHAPLSAGAEVSLTSPALFVRIASERARPGAEILYRRTDASPARGRTADIGLAANLDALAYRIGAQLGLLPPASNAAVH